MVLRGRSRRRRGAAGVHAHGFGGGIKKVGKLGGTRNGRKETAAATVLTCVEWVRHCLGHPICLRPNLVRSRWMARSSRLAGPTIVAFSSCQT
jgi:hypothetical protein